MPKKQVEITKLGLIPLPVNVEVLAGFYEFSPLTIIKFNDYPLKSPPYNVATYLANYLSKFTEFKLEDRYLEGASPNGPTRQMSYKPASFEKVVDSVIWLYIDLEMDAPSPEGYKLSITEGGITIGGKSEAGLFYGVQTLRQLLPASWESVKEAMKVKDQNKVPKISMPYIEITDYPQFAWRGFMLDEVRHFFGKTFVKRMLDLLALHKINKLHWHITDDEGWRIESKKFPLLNSVGSTRLVSKKWKETFNGEDPAYYSGYYSQEDIQEIVRYAKDRYIEIIPEIEMPGHATAPLVAYSEYSCAKPPAIVPTVGAGNRHAYCAGYPPTYDFLEDILMEVIELFPTDHIHIGGDELPSHRWKECPRCKHYMEEKGIQDLDGMQINFASNIIKFLAKQGKVTHGWFDFSVDRLLELGIPPETMVFQFWVGSPKKVNDFIRKGGHAIISDHRYVYLDSSYFGTSLKKAYNFDPIPSDLELKYHSRVLGMETPIWTERVPNLQRMDWQVFPRLTAHAETMWTRPELKDYRNFLSRLKSFIPRLDNLNVYYASLGTARNSLLSRLNPKPN